MTQNQLPGFQEPEISPKRDKAIVYVDGFNFYHGSIKGTSHKWLNLQKLFELLRNSDDVVKVHYLTAPMHGEQGERQQVYLQALATLPKVNVILGKYKTKRVHCDVQQCTYSEDRRFTTWEEKRTDVNIAIQMVDDAYQEKCNTMVVVSGDSDLVPAIHMVKLRCPDMKIVAYIPARNEIRGAAVEIRGAADRHRTLPMQLLSRCQLPQSVPDGAGGTIEKPSAW